MRYSLLLATLVLSLSLSKNAKTVTRHIDDSLGDSATGVKPVYFPRGKKIWQDQSCGRVQGYRLVPDTEKTHNKTYTAATYKTSMDDMGFDLSFQGTSIAVYFILANDGSDGTTVRTECNFTLDGSLRKTYTHKPIRGHGIEYDVEVYKEDGLAGDQMHTLEVSTGKKAQREVSLALDYAVYTFKEADDQNTTSSSAPAQDTNTKSLPNNAPQTVATTGTSNGASETATSSNSNSNQNSLVQPCLSENYVMSTFEVPHKEVKDDFAVWHVAKLKSNRGSLVVNQFNIDYSGMLGFGVGQVNTGRVLTPGSMVEVKPGQFTVLTWSETDPIWSNLMAASEDGMRNSMRVTNNTGRDQAIAFGLFKTVGTATIFCCPPFGFKTLGASQRYTHLGRISGNISRRDETFVELSFYPKLRIYMSHGYKRKFVPARDRGLYIV
ncbi:hypothetical protein PQX77_021241 [Marasmius sp. AFHP31]|nr:hypothetical protein PQX77_021241 [Marasmius sp. AFHP31]